MRQYRDELEAMGHIVTSRWIDEDLSPEGDFAGAAAKGLKDIEDIGMAFHVLFFTDVPSTTGGMHVEFGYALARGRTLSIIGPLVNIFHKQANYHFQDWDHFKRRYLNAPANKGAKVQATTQMEDNA